MIKKIITGILVVSFFICSCIWANEANLLDDIDHNFRLHEEFNQYPVQAQVQWLSEHPKLFRNLMLRSIPYLYFVHQEVMKRNMPGEIALLPLVESGYDPFAYSFAGASGLWQLMPVTSTDLGLRMNRSFDERRDIYSSTRAALDYLLQLNRYFDGDWLLTLAAYDAGATNVDIAITKNVRDGKSVDYWSLPLPSEARAYLPRLLAFAEVIHHRDRYPLEFPEISNEPYFDRVEVDRPIALKEVARLAQVDESEVLRLNPGLKSWSLVPHHHASVLLPIEKIDLFKENLKTWTPTKHEHFRLAGHYRIYRVKPGDTIYKIAHHLHLSTRKLMVWNHLKSNKSLMPRQKLVIFA